ncbi:MAG: TonB-dependent receptor, partial [Rhodospirillaceae bacterium]
MRQRQMSLRWCPAAVGRACAASALLAAIATSAPAGAQTGSSGPQTQVSLSIDEIVVTARKREEALRSIPQAIHVLTAEDLERLNVGVSGEIAEKTPNLMWHSILGFSTPQIFLRGIGNATFNANQANPVGIHFDDIYQGSNITYGFGLFDLERVEVLKGPQGTLFGRNTTGGVINFIPRKPNPDDQLNGEISATYGRFNEIDLEAAVGAAFSEKTAGRLSALIKQRDGYVTNINPA